MAVVDLDILIQIGVINTANGVFMTNNKSDNDPRKAVIFDSRQDALDSIDQSTFFQRVEGLRLPVRENGKIVDYIFDGGDETFDPNNDDHFIKANVTDIKERVITLTLNEIGASGYQDNVPQKVIDYAVANNLQKDPSEIIKVEIINVAESAQIGNWSNSATWVNGNKPFNGDEVIINSTHIVTLDQDAKVSSLTTNFGPGFNYGIIRFEEDQSRTLQILGGGSIISDGSFVANNGTVLFLGTGTITSSSFSIQLNDVDIVGDVDFGTQVTINGELTIENGGSVVNLPPRYSPNSTLIYNSGSTFNRGLEWSSLLDEGYPNNIIIQNNTILDISANSGENTARQCAGDLTIDAGSTITLENMTEAVTVLGNIVNNGTIILSSTVGGELRVDGTFTNNGTLIENANSVVII